MTEIQNNPFIEWCQVNSHDCLKFTFKERLTLRNAEIAIVQWKKLFELNPEKKIVLIWHCLEMTGYEPMARIRWQKAIKELKDQIDCVWLISDSKLIYAGAKIMSMFTSFNINIARNEDMVLAG